MQAFNVITFFPLRVRGPACICCHQREIIRPPRQPPLTYLPAVSAQYTGVSTLPHSVTADTIARASPW